MSKSNKAVYKTASYKQTKQTIPPPPLMDSRKLTRLTYKRTTPITIYAPKLPPNCGKEPVSFSARKHKRQKLILLNIWWQLAAPYILALVNYGRIYQSVYDQWGGMIFNVHILVQDITELIDWNTMKDKVKNVIDIKAAIISTLY
eukprot:35434_1